MPGRKPLPDQIKILRGTDQPVRMSNGPKLQVQIPMPPDWLSEKAKEAYQELSSVLYDMKVLSVADRTALVLLCESYATYRECYEFIKEHGRTYQTGSVQTYSLMHRVRPEVAMMNEAWKQVRSMLAEFGLTPSSRTKVTPMGEGEEDPFTAFLKKN